MNAEPQSGPIANWQAGETVDGFALVRRAEVRQDRNGQDYADLELADATGAMAAKIWPDSPALARKVESGSFVAVRGRVKAYRGELQLSVQDCRPATDDDRTRGFDPALLVPTTRADIDQLWTRLTEVFAIEVERPLLRRLAREALDAWGEPLREHPAAKTIHHAYRGGLIEHVASMTELALSVCAQYDELDRDLVLLGVLFHDLGKIRELSAMPGGDYTADGRLIGHIVAGRDMLLERTRAIPDFPRDIEQELEHLILSHHGRREYGSPVQPATAEALVLHFIDDLDSKLNQVVESLRDVEGFRWLRGMGRHVYRRPSPPAATAATEPETVAASRPAD